MNVRKMGGSLALLTMAGAMPATGQGRAIDVSYGRWWLGSGASAQTFSATLRRPLLGPLGYGLGFLHIQDSPGGTAPVAVPDRTQTGGELSLTAGGVGNGLYGIGSVSLGLRHDDGTMDATWSTGVGYGLSALSVVRLGVEVRYRVEDTGVRGFWRLDPTDRRGLSLQAGLAIRFGHRGGGRTVRRPGRNPRPVRGPGPPPATGTVERNAREAGASEAAARTAALVVGTALEVMGTPYKWGGTDANGFDCSGLIQYAYGRHGLIIPRVSRDQIRYGTRVDADLAALRPGDILGFAVNGRRISHVGLYVGDGQFIHSASGGVKLSSLTSDDPDSRWWQRRWVAARRILN